MKKWLLLVLLTSLIAIWPYFKSGYFESHDGEWMVIRFTAFHQTLRAGQIPVRFVDRLNQNYGYPVSNFLYPAPFYFAEVPKILGFGFVNSIKIIFALSVLVSAVAMFWALSQVFKFPQSAAGAIIYVFTPYRLLDLYVRGSLGESVAFAITPLILGCIFKISKGHKGFLPLLSLSEALLILSHNVMALIFSPFLLIMALLVIKARLQIIFFFALGLLISAFFSIPALYDLRYVYLSQIHVSSVRDHLVNFWDLIIPSWGYGPTPTVSGGLSTQIGVVPLLIIVIAAIASFRIRQKLIIFQLTAFLIVFLLMTKPSLPFWQNLPFSDLIQFPWRLLSLIVFIVAYLTAYLASNSKKKNLTISVLIIASVFLTIPYTKPRLFVNRGDDFYATNEDSTTVRDEYLPLWVKEKPSLRSYEKIQPSPSYDILSQVSRPSRYQAIIESKATTQVFVNTIYFPGWQVTIDEVKSPIEYNNKYGLITFQLPEGKHEVIINYTRSPVHLTSEIISLFGIIIGGLFILKWRKHF